MAPTQPEPAARLAARPGELSARDLPLARRIAVGMFVVGALNSYAALLVPKPDTSDHPADVVLATLLLAAGLLLSVLRPRARILQTAIVYGILIITAICAAARPIGTTPFFYLWPVVLGAYFFSRRFVAMSITVMAASFGVALIAWSDATLKSIMFTGIVSTVTLMAIVVVLMREHQARLVNQLYLASTTDPLTGLLNRRAFESAFAREIDRAERANVPLSLICFDLDFFKQCNDRFGHAAGDRVLRHFAALIDGAVQTSDLAARIGGEELALALFNTPSPAARALAEGLGREILTAQCYSETSTTFSAGIASRGDCKTPGELMRLADRALYAAKEAGRQRIAVWDGAMHVGEHGYGHPAAAQAA